MVQRVQGNPSAWRNHVPDGGGGDIEVQDDGVVVVPAATALNFTGPGVVVTPGPPGQANVDVPGGALPPLQTASFLDSATQDLNVGPDTLGQVAVEMNISKANGESSSFRLDIAVSGTGVDISTLIIDSDAPLTDIDVTVLLSAGSVIVRLTGSGGGVATTVNYRVVDTIIRAF